MERVFTAFNEPGWLRSIAVVVSNVTAVIDANLFNWAAMGHLFAHKIQDAAFAMRH